MKIKRYVGDDGEIYNEPSPLWLELLRSPVIAALVGIPIACISCFSIALGLNLTGTLDFNRLIEQLGDSTEPPNPVATFSEVPTQTPIITTLSPNQSPSQTPFIITVTTSPLLPNSVISTEATQSTFSNTSAGCFCTEYTIPDNSASGCPGITISSGFEIPASSIFLPNNNNSIMYVYLNSGIADTSGVLFRYRTEMYGGGQPASRACVEDQFQWIKPERSPVYR